MPTLAPPSMSMSLSRLFRHSGNDQCLPPGSGSELISVNMVRASSRSGPGRPGIEMNPRGVVPGGNAAHDGRSDGPCLVQTALLPAIFLGQISMSLVTVAPLAAPFAGEARFFDR